MKRFILLSPFFHPESISTGKYNTLVAKALSALGHQVTVVCSHPLYPTWKPLYSNSEVTGVRILRGGLYIRYATPLVLRRLTLEIWFLIHALIQVARLRKDFDILIPVFPPSLFFQWCHILMRPSQKAVGIVHDLQDVHAGDKNGIRKLSRRFVRFVEARAFRRCDKLIFLSREMAKRAVINYSLDASRVVVCYPFVTISGRSPSTSGLAAVFAEGFRHVVYSGALGQKQAPQALFNFFSLAAKARPDLQFHVFSAGGSFEVLKARSLEDPLTNLLFHDLVAEEYLEELYSRSDVQVLPQAANSSEGCLPSKLPNVLASGAGILAICDAGSEMAELLRSVKHPEVAHSWIADELVQRLDQLLRRNLQVTHAERREMSLEQVNSLFSIETLIGELTNG